MALSLLRGITNLVKDRFDRDEAQPRNFFADTIASVPAAVKTVAKINFGVAQRAATTAGQTASRVTGAVAPGVPLLLRGIRTGDFDPYVSTIRQNSPVPNRSPVTRDASGRIQLDPEAAQQFDRFVGGFTGEGPRRALSQIAKELAPVREVSKIVPRLIDEGIDPTIAERAAPLIANTRSVRTIDQEIETARQASQNLSFRSSRVSGQSSRGERLAARTDLPPARPSVEPTPRIQASPAQVSSLADDAARLASRPIINVDNFNVSDEGRRLLNDEIEGLRRQLEEATGAPVSNKEALAAAEASGKLLSRQIGREETLRWEAAMLRTRQLLADQAESGTVTREFIENLQVLKSQGADIGRKLQSLSITADPKAATPKQVIIESVLKQNDNIDEILAAADGVDFNDPEQATRFYRQFIKPTLGEWIDLIRYNSMLSSPKTHIINIFSGSLNSLLTPVLTKALRGGIDLFSTKLQGKDRTAYAGEAAAYLAGYAKSLSSAGNRFAAVWRGERDFTNLDFRAMRLTTGGPGRVVENSLAVPSKLLESMDQFFMELVTGAERAALNYRQGKGVKVPQLDAKATEAAEYYLFRQEPGSKDQGYLLGAIDHLTLMLSGLRKHDNPLIRWTSKLTFPFIQTPMNIVKQSIEFTPAGFLTIPGATNKTDQLTKALLGSGIAMVGGLALSANRMTWAEPKGTDARNAFREAGMQPYSIKLGNRWYSYQKLNPVLSAPLVFVAMTYDAMQNGDLDETGGERVLTVFAKYAEFLSDQSYFKGVGDLVGAVTGDEFAAERLVGNYPQQLLPYRALSGWLARMIDPLQRTIDYDASYVEKQMQLLMLSMPFLSQKLPAREGPTGPIPNRDRFLNAFSPIQTGTQTDEQAAQYGEVMELNRRIKQQSKESEKTNELVAEIAAQALAMPRDEAIEWLTANYKNDPILKEKIKDEIKSQQLGLTYNEKKLKQLGVENGERARYIVERMAEFPDRQSQIEYLESLKTKRIITPEVQKQIRKILGETANDEVAAIRYVPLASAGGNRPQRNNNPGNVKIGGVGDRFALKDASGRPMTDEQGHLVFASPEDGLRAVEADIDAKVSGQSQAAQRKLGRQAQTIAELNQVYAEDQNWRNNVVAALKKLGVQGVNTGTRLASIPRDALIRAIMTAEGYFAEGGRAVASTGAKALRATAPKAQAAENDNEQPRKTNRFRSWERVGR